MSNQKDLENMKKLDSCYQLVQQSSAKGGVRAVEIADKLDISKSAVHDRLNSLYYMGKVYSDQGYWKATTGEQTIKPLEKEIVIELPIPKNQLQYMVLLEVLANYGEDRGYSEVAKILGTIIEKFNETRTIKIKGKNVEDLDLEKIATLIQQASERSSKVSLKGLLKRLKKS